MPKSVAPLVIEETDVNTLKGIVSGNSLAGSDIVKRAKAILMLSTGKAIKDVANEVGYRENTVTDIRRRFLAEGMNSLEDHKRPGRPAVRSAADVIETQLDSFVAAYSAEHGIIPSVKTVAAELNGAENVVREVMKSKGYIQGRKPSLDVFPSDSMSPVIVNIVGLYLSHSQGAVVVRIQDTGSLPGADEQCAVGVCTSKAAAILSSVSVEDNYVGLVDALDVFMSNGEGKGDRSSSPNSKGSCAAFIEASIEENREPNAKYRVLAFGNPILETGRAIISDTLLESVENKEEWLSKYEELLELVFTPGNDYEHVLNIVTGIERYIRQSTPNTETVLWKKSLVSAYESTSSVEDSPAAKPGPGTVEVVARIMGDDGEWITATVQAEFNMKVADFDTDTMQGYLNSADVVEKTIAVATHEAAGALNQRYLAEVVKKNRNMT